MHIELLVYYRIGVWSVSASFPEEVRRLPKRPDLRKRSLPMFGEWVLPSLPVCGEAGYSFSTVVHVVLLRNGAVRR